MSNSVQPHNGSPPGSPVPGILQARTLEWVAISFSNTWKWKMKAKLLSCVQLLATPWTVAYQAPPSMGFSRQEYWSGGHSFDVLIFLFGTSLLFHVQLCCFLTCIQISQEAGQMVWYSHLFQNFPQFVVIHTVKGFGIVNKAEIDVFLELSCFSDDPRMLAIWSLFPRPFLKPAWTSGIWQFTYCWSLAWRILSITLLACEMAEIVW